MIRQDGQKNTEAIQISEESGIQMTQSHLSDHQLVHNLDAVQIPKKKLGIQIIT